MTESSNNTEFIDKKAHVILVFFSGTTVFLGNRPESPRSALNGQLITEKSRVQAVAQSFFEMCSHKAGVRPKCFIQVRL